MDKEAAAHQPTPVGRMQRVRRRTHGRPPVTVADELNESKEALSLICEEARSEFWKFSFESY